jgi:hypothetical protein
VPALAEVVPNPNSPGIRDHSGVAKPTWPLGALKDAEWSYIRISPIDRLYQMSRHFVWVMPLANLVVFLGVGMCLATITRLWTRPGA